MVYCKPYDKDVIISFMTLYRFMQKKFPKVKLYVDEWVLDEI